MMMPVRVHPRPGGHQRPRMAWLTLLAVVLSALMAIPASAMDSLPVVPEERPAQLHVLFSGGGIRAEYGGFLARVSSPRAPSADTLHSP